MTGVAAEEAVGSLSLPPRAPRELEGSGAIAVPDVEPAGDRRHEPEAATERVEIVAVRGRSITLGGLIVRAVDRETQQPLASFAVRLLSETRFADERHEGQGELALALTPATYAMLVTSPGYEPVELPTVRIVGGETVRLAPVELSPGSGRILVEAFGATTFDGLSVELRGVGRCPCPRCVEVKNVAHDRCPDCGFAREDTSLPIGPDGRVEFTGLAQGLFALRVVDQQGCTIGDESGLELGLGETATVLFDVSRWRAIEVEVVDVDGFSLSAEWSRRLAAPPVEVEEEIVSFESSDNTIRIDFELRRNARVVATANLVPPAREGMVSFGFSVGRGRGHFALERLTADRERVEGDALWPVPVAPVFAPPEVACELDSSGIAVLSPLSTSGLELHLTASNLVAGAIVPPGNGRTRVRVQFQATESAITYRALELRGAR